MAMDMWADYRLLWREKETPTVLSLIFEAVRPKDSPNGLHPGTHVPLKLGGHLIRAYSVVEGNQNLFTLGVALERRTSRGGSLYLHENLKEGDIVTISNFATTFPLAKEADYHVLIAGCIEITVLIAACHTLQRDGHAYHLHCKIRSPADVAFRPYLDVLGANVTIYSNRMNKPFHVPGVLQKADSNTHIYCCSGERLMKDVRDTASELGLPKENIHFEAFQTSGTGDPFTAKLADSRKKVEVASGETLLDALRESRFDIPSTCEAGNCGTCRVGVRSGQIEHHGTGLLENEKDSAMLSCVS